MVKKQGFFGRVWGKLTDEQKIGIMVVCVANALLSFIALVPQVGPVLVGVLYATELVIIFGFGMAMIIS